VLVWDCFGVCLKVCLCVNSGAISAKISGSIKPFLSENFQWYLGVNSGLFWNKPKGEFKACSKAAIGRKFQSIKVISEAAKR
jgi:hypothetical protein